MIKYLLENVKDVSVFVGFIMLFSDNDYDDDNDDTDGQTMPLY